MSIFITIVLLSSVFFGGNLAVEDQELKDYFQRPGRNVFQLNILLDYEVERYVFPRTLSNSEDEVENSNDVDSTVVYRIPGGPKSPRAHGKRPSFIQHGILCDVDPCTVNKPQIAVAYLLVDQGYDVWLGISNSSMAENLISSEALEKKKLENIAQYILNATNQPELLVMGYFNGAVQFFGMKAQKKEPPQEQSRISKWFEKIPGVKTVKGWYTNIYNKGKTYLSRGYNKVVDSFDSLGKKTDYIIDDPAITNLKETVLKAWGVVTNLVIPTFNIDDFSKMIEHPDLYLDTPQLITKYGYTAETHEILTEDGYLLSIHRISGSKKYPTKHGKPVVFLQHGILSSSAVWILNGPSKGLGYILADEGYDVWMGNSRGNTYSRAHVNLTTNNMEFWDFSWHEMGVYDVPATIDYILSVTKQKKLYYLGHSQGTTSFFVMMSVKPEYNDKIIKFAAYAPIVYAGNIRSPIIKIFAKISSPIYNALSLMKMNDFLPSNALLTKMGRYSCEARTVYQVICTNLLFMMTGYDTSQINKTMVPIILGHLPAGSSTKQLLHYSQEFNSKKFQQFNYMDPNLNMRIYGQTTPPEYKINNTKVPVGIFYASNDLVSDTRDVKRLANELPNSDLLYKIPMELFNHIDFMFAIDAPALLYGPTITYFKKP